MKSWLAALDRILRGEATRLAELKGGMHGLPVRGLTLLIALMGATYGICMGCFAIFNRENPQYLQIVASMIKVPALYLLTLLVTLPSLYVFNALVGSRLRFTVVIRLLVASLAVSLTVLASFGPIVAFFSLTTTSYPFMKLLNVAVYALSGILGLGFLLQTMHRLALMEDGIGQGESRTEPAAQGAPSTILLAPAPKSDSESPAASEATKLPTLTDFPGELVKEPVPAPPPPKPGDVPRIPAPLREPAGALDFIPSTTMSQNVQIVFACWVALFALVGAQMSWVLRPFIGAPDREFTWFRSRESNFFDAVLKALFDLFK